jgi:hypothetical protein
MNFFTFDNPDWFTMLIVANPTPLFLLKISELSKTMRKQLWKLINTCESINIKWIIDLTKNFNNLSIQPCKLTCNYSGLGIFYNINDNPIFVKSIRETLIVGNILGFKI